MYQEAASLMPLVLLVLTRLLWSLAGLHIAAHSEIGGHVAACRSQTCQLDVLDL